MGTMLYRCSIGVWQTIHDGMSALTLGLTVLNHVETHIKDQERLVSIPILVDCIIYQIRAVAVAAMRQRVQALT